MKTNEDTEMSRVQTRKNRLDKLLRINGAIFLGSILAFMLGLLWNMCTWVICLRGVITSIVLMLAFAFILHLLFGVSETKKNDNV